MDSNDAAVEATLVTRGARPSFQQFSLFSRPAVASVAGLPGQGVSPTVPKVVEAARESTQIKIQGKIRRQIFPMRGSPKGSANGYLVLSVQLDGSPPSGGGEHTVQVTTSLDPMEGDRIIALGEWALYKGTRQFKADSIQLEIPLEAQGIAAWLRRGGVEGVGAATVNKLVAFFGENLKSVIGDADAMAPAIALKKATAIAKAWTSNASQPELQALLAGYDLNAKQIARVIETYGASIKKLVRTNPWELVEIGGIGFPTADKIAMKERLNMTCGARIQAGLEWVLTDRMSSKGHCGIPRELLISEATRMLGVEDEVVEDALPRFLDGIRVVDDTDVGLIYPKSLWESENSVADYLSAMVLRNSGWVGRLEAESLIERAEVELGVTLDRDGGQFEAASAALSSGIIIITGGPGTGKSTTQAVIVKAFSYIGKGVDEVALGAPTGRAAKRLADTSGRSARTIHRMLEWSPFIEGFAIDENNPLKQDVVIIDEFSMVELRLCSALVRSLKPRSCLIVVGDFHQLPSVGPGQILRDMIESGVIPVVRLTRVHRQAEGSGIAIAAQRINNGQTPNEPGNAMRGFTIFDCPDRDVIARVIDLVRFELPEMGFDPMKDVQVIAAKKEGDVSVPMLNEALKAALNPAFDDENSVMILRRYLTINDRVMQMKNDYAKGVHNGEVGTVTAVGYSVGPSGNRVPFVIVDFSGLDVRYTTEDISDIVLSYAATVHKSMGCEFPVVVMVAAVAHRGMLNRKLLYTGLTRARTECYIVGNRRLVDVAASVGDQSLRYTGLQKRLRAAVGLAVAA